MTKIYHNPRCRKSRAGLAYLQGKTTDIQIREYLKEPFTPDELIQVISKTGMKPFEIVRKQEDVYKKQFKGKIFSDKEWIDILIKNPKLIERPTVVSSQKAILAQPPEKIDEII